jgi:hypothetical protein
MSCRKSIHYAIKHLHFDLVFIILALNLIRFYNDYSYEEYSCSY